MHSLERTERRDRSSRNSLAGQRACLVSHDMWLHVAPPSVVHPRYPALLLAGAKAITMKQAIVLAAFCEFGGAVLLVRPSPASCPSHGRPSAVPTSRFALSLLGCRDQE